MDTWSDLLRFFPSGPNFGPFTPGAGTVAGIIAVILALGALIALGKLVISSIRWVASSDPQKKEVAKSNMKSSGIYLGVIIGLGVILSIVAAILAAVL